MKKQTVMVSGATSGFGAACAHQFARNGYQLIINGRRRERLEKLQQTLKEAYNTECHIAAFDVQDRKAVFAAISDLPQNFRAIDVLINNAGLALGRDPFDQANLDDWDTMLDTNVKGLLYLSKAVIPAMIAARKGHIINIGSISGKEVYENGNVYCASKYAVDAISKAMRIELLPYHIKVTAIHPGAAETEFSVIRFKGNKEAADKVYSGLVPLTAKDIADIAYFTATLPDHVCINDLVVTPTQQANSFYFNRQ
jgi:3-hydroxy acid dehydrogenase / malonic semialdehyde reductase